MGEKHVISFHVNPIYYTVFHEFFYYRNMSIFNHANITSVEVMNYILYHLELVKLSCLYIEIAPKLDLLGYQCIEYS